MSSNRLSIAEQNFIRFVKACVELIKLPLIDILTDQIDPGDLFNQIGSCDDLLTGEYKLLPFQRTLCYLPPPDVPDYKLFDVTLLYKLIINLCSSLNPPTKGWFKKPTGKDKSIGADIERLRLLKNRYSHDDSAEFPDIEFQKVWKDLKYVIKRFQKGTWRTYDYEGELEKIERLKFGYEDWDQCKLFLKATLNLWEQLNHKDEPEILIKGENNVLFGDKARFDVEIKNTDNNSNWLVTWKKKTGDISKILRASDEKYKESTNRRLFIWSVCKEDEAEYHAVIYTGEKSSIFSNSIHLHGLGDMPFFSVWDIKTDKKELTINYEYGVTQSSPQVFEVKWAKNGKPLNWENNRYLGGSLNDKYLTITSPTSDGKGTYSCTVTNAVGSVSKDFTFDVPNATISTDNSEVVFGSETKVKSLVASCPKPDGVEWQKSKDGNFFLGIDINKPHYHGSSLNSESPLLLISKTVFDDVLYYRLHVWNKIGEHFSDPLFLDVKGNPPNITSSHETDIENHSVKLIGKVFLYDQFHEILDVFWSMGEKKLDNFEGKNKYSKVSTKDPSLTIFNVNEHDAGSYQLTATNAVGQTKSHVIVLDKPQISFDTDTSLVFNAMIQSIPAAYRAQWKMKGKDEDTFTAIKSNTKEYLEISNSLPQPVLVLKQRELLESKCFLIEVYNFVGKNVKEILCNEVSETSIKTEGDILSDIFKTKGSKIRFNNLRLKLIESLAEKDLQNLKETLEVLTPLGKEFRDMNSISDFISRLWERGVITERNVIIMQYLMRSLKRMDLEQMFVKYATKDKQALCYFEDPLNQDGHKVSLHVVDNLENFTTREDLLQTVADIVDCEPTDIHVIALQPENSFIIVMTMREDLVRKLKEINPLKLRKLSQFKVDWIQIEDKVINIVEDIHSSMTETADKLSSESKHRTDVPFGNENAEIRDYRLPLGKMYHLYIAHSKEEIEEAITLCKNIESRFQLKCMISCRDFLVERFQQIQYMMKKCVTILLLLSPAFLKDKNSVFEMRLAVEMFCDRKFSAGIINVILQDLDGLPLSLKPYICIKAQKISDIAAKISETFCQSDIHPSMADTTAKLSKKIGHGTEISPATENAERGDYKRPDGKKYDLCIVHSNADRNEAFDIYKDLENRFQLKCLIFCYDTSMWFPRVHQIQDMMKKSIGAVFLLSPAFFEGSDFVFAMELALKMSCDRNFTVGIINVLSQDVGELPPLLKPFICIEAQKTCDIAAKISEAICQIDIHLSMTDTAAKLSRKIEHRTEIPFGIENAERDVYELPYEKNYHLCIVHSNADRKEAIDLCHDLESRFHLECIISDSEFSMGPLRVKQMQTFMMMESVGIVLLLSPAFFKDKYCVSGMELAVEISCDRFFSAGIINVLLQDVGELPLLLKPYICIEAQKSCDIAAKINDTFCQTDIHSSMTKTAAKLSRKIEHRTDIPFGIENAERDVYELPYGKKYHLFIVHSNADIEEAIDLCHDLESRFNLKCIAKFLMGPSRVEEMQGIMKKSVGIVLLLSPAFFKDNNCVFDMALAVEMNDQNFSAGIINVLLQDIDELPLLLKPYICIEAQKIHDVAAKINDTFCKAVPNV